MTQSPITHSNLGRSKFGSTVDLDQNTSETLQTNRNSFKRFAGMKLDDNSLLSAIIKARYWILTAALTGGLFSILFHWINPVVYQSTAVVQVLDNGNGPDSSPVSLMYVSPSVRVILQQATSTRMYDHLIKKLDLSSNYGISSTDPNYLEKIYAILDRRILVHKSDENAVSIEVSDPSPAFAARMANALAQELQEYSQKVENDQLGALKKVYSMLVAKNQERSKDLSNQLAQVLKSELLDAKNPESKSDIHFQVAALVTQVSSSEEDLRRNSEYLEVAGSLMGKLKQPKVLILKKAMRDINTSTLWSSAVTLASAVFLSVLLSLFCIILWHFHGRNAIWALTREDLHPIPGISGNGWPQETRPEHLRQ